MPTKKFNPMFFSTGKFSKIPGLYIPINKTTLGVDGINKQGAIQTVDFIPVDNNPICNIEFGVKFVLI